MAEQQDDELRVVATAVEPVMLLAQEVFAAAICGSFDRTLRGLSNDADVSEQVRAAALAFVGAHADRIAQQLLELGAAFAAAGVAEIALAVVDGVGPIGDAVAASSAEDFARAFGENKPSS